MVLSGQGVELSGEGRAISLRPGAPARFAGDTVFQSRLAGGPVRVLNLFVLRGAAQARVACLGAPEHACMAGSLPDAAREGPRTRLIVAVSAGRLRGPVPGAQWDLDAGDFTVGHGDGDAPDVFVPAEAPAPGSIPALRLDITVLASGSG